MKSIQNARDEYHRGKKADGRRSTDDRPIKAIVYSTSTNDLQSVAEIFYRNFERENIAEMFGTAKQLSNELARFQHGFRVTKTCPICGHCNENGDKGNTQCQNTLLCVSAVDDGGIEFLIEPQRIRQAVHAFNPGAGVVGHYRDNRRLWSIGDVLEVDIRDPHPLLVPRRDASMWSKWGADGDNQQKRHFGPLPELEADFIHVKLQMFQPCGRYLGGWYNGPKYTDVKQTIIKEDVFLMCLYSEISHGLDLSFVTHIYLLEPIEDAALLEQVTSRAHRLGATGPVKIETVNVWQGLSERLIEATKVTRASSKNKSVCRYCCRTFECRQVAMEHEATNCPSNPRSQAVYDGFSIQDIYRQIRPPLTASHV